MFRDRRVVEKKRPESKGGGGKRPVDTLLTDRHVESLITRFGMELRVGGTYLFREHTQSLWQRFSEKTLVR